MPLEHALVLTAVAGVLIGVALVRHHLHVVYRISGRGGRRMRCGITRARRFSKRMREYRTGKDRSTFRYHWPREVWCWVPVPYRLCRLVRHDGWVRRCVTVQFVWGRERVLRVEEAEIRRCQPAHNVQHTRRERVAA
jgi:hypothetical protein